MWGFSSARSWSSRLFCALAADGLFDILAPTFGATPDLAMRRSSDPHSLDVQTNIVPSASSAARQLQGLMQ